MNICTLSVNIQQGSWRKRQKKNSAEMPDPTSSSSFSPSVLCGFSFSSSSEPQRAFITSYTHGLPNRSAVDVTSLFKEERTHHIVCRTRTVSGHLWAYVHAPQMHFRLQPARSSLWRSVMTRGDNARPPVPAPKDKRSISRGRQAGFRPP